ncbi:UNVERIFIED_ORG: putative membrane protein [Clostridioides difficile F501]
MKPLCWKNLTTSLRLTILSPIPFIVNTIYILASSCGA